MPHHGTGVKLLERVRGELRARHRSPRTVEAYVSWIRRYVIFHDRRHPAELGEPDIANFLTYLANERGVSASTQSQAASALLFLYRHVLRRRIDRVASVPRASKPRRLPVVLTREEVRAVLADLRGTKRIIGALLYGSGLRLLECLELRVKDLDFARGEIRLRRGKGARDRVTLLPASAKEPLAAYLRRVRERFERERSNGGGYVRLPDALDRKWPGAAREWAWQYIFPASRTWCDPATGRRIPPTFARRPYSAPVKAAVRRAGITKRATCHAFRHSFATHLPEEGYDIRTI